MSGSGLDATFYDRHAFAPDPVDPVDRWCQLPQSGNRASVAALIEELGLGVDGNVLLDPFCGAGSTLLAGAMRGGRVVGCDLEPGAAAVSALKLAAPGLADHLRGHRGSGLPGTPIWRWAATVARAVDALDPAAEPLLAKIVADCGAADPGWTTGTHRVVCSSAQHVVEALGATPGSAPRNRIDVFTSLPHLTGRPSPWRRADGADGAGGSAEEHAMLDAPDDAGLLTAGPQRTARVETTAREALASLLSSLVRREALGRVAIEFERSVDRRDADQSLAEVLERSGLQSIEVVTLYEGAPDDLGGVIGGGLVLGRA